MGKFRITGPDGKQYNVTGETAEGALQALQQHLGGTATPDPGFNQFKQMMQAGAIQQPTFDPVGNFQKLDDVVRTTANGASFGMADRLEGYMNGTGTEAARERSAAARARLGPVMAPVAEIGGSMLPASKLMQLGATATRLPGIVGKYAGMAIDGSLFGAAQAAGNDQDILQGAAFGAGAGAAGQLVGKAAGKLFSGKKADTLKEMVEQKIAAYKAVDNSGIVYPPNLTQDLATGIDDSLMAGGLDDVFHPKATRANKIIGEKFANPQTITQLDKMRQFVRDNVVDAPGMPQNEGHFSSMIQDNIDEFIDAQGNGPLIKTARELNQKVRKTEAVERALTTAEHRAGSTGSGGNVDNASRQNIRAILDNPKRSRGFSPDEKALMEKITMGTRGHNAARQVGKLSPSGNGLQQALAIGATAYNPWMGVIPGIGIASKFAADRGTKKLVKELMDTIAVGGKASDAAALKTLSPKAKSLVDAIARAIMVGGVTAGPQYQR